jgi:hypothetical protein
MNGASVTAQAAGPAFDASVPNAARIYDFLLGGKDNFHADRDAARRLLAALPGSARAARDNRDFLQRAVRYLATTGGVRQFIDIGSGLPTAGNVHQVARDADPCARVAYVDYDPVVVTHARALLADSGNVAVIGGDLRKPADILASLALTRLIDFREPAAVLLIAVTHFIIDDERPREIIRELTDVLPSGSYLALTHVTADHVSATAAATATGVYDGASAPVTARTREQVTEMFAGMDLIHPGVTDVRALRPGAQPSQQRRKTPSMPTYIYGGIAIKP